MRAAEAEGALCLDLLQEMVAEGDWLRFLSGAVLMQVLHLLCTKPGAGAAALDAGGDAPGGQRPPLCVCLPGSSGTVWVVWVFGPQA